ncbi:MAG: tetratricopeptide repeat-containing protein [Candidatus Obscuribacterales bacterium]|nr:tetratricopeptide repeat-containing protein [Candidatus Obscuribacterales bacterium]
MHKGHFDLVINNQARQIGRALFWPAVFISLFSVATSSSALALSETEKEWDRLQRGGTDNLDANRYWLAEPLLQQAVVKAGCFGMADLRLAKSYGELGRLYTIRGRFAEAEPYLERELLVRQQATGDAGDAAVPAMGSLVKFYLNYGTASKGDLLTEEILAFVGGKSRELASQSKGKLTLQAGVPLSGWAGSIQPSQNEPLLEWAITCDDLGNQYRLRGNYDLADRLFKAALDMKSTILGKQHLSLANSYDNLGLLYLTKNDDKEAESYLRESLEITERILQPSDWQVYARLDKLAKCLIKRGKYKEAEELYLKSLSFWKAEPSKNGEEARVFYALGCLYSDQKNYGAAAPMLHKALELSEHFNGPYSISLVPYLQKYAYVLYYLGRRPETDHLRARANTIAADL